MRKPNPDQQRTVINLDPKIKKAAMKHIEAKYGKRGSLSFYLSELVKQDIIRSSEKLKSFNSMLGTSEDEDNDYSDHLCDAIEKKSANSGVRSRKGV